MANIDTSPLEEHLVSVISDIINGKVSRQVEPCHADIQEIVARVGEDVRVTLNGMVKSGLLSFHRTLNSVTFEFTPPK